MAFQHVVPSCSSSYQSDNVSISAQYGIPGQTQTAIGMPTPATHQGVSPYPGLAGMSSLGATSALQMNPAFGLQGWGMGGMNPLAPAFNTEAAANWQLLQQQQLAAMSSLQQPFQLAGAPPTYIPSSLPLAQVPPQLAMNISKDSGPKQDDMISKIESPLPPPPPLRKQPSLVSSDRLAGTAVQHSEPLLTVGPPTALGTHSVVSVQEQAHFSSQNYVKETAKTSNSYIDVQPHDTGIYTTRALRDALSMPVISSCNTVVSHIQPDSTQNDLHEPAYHDQDVMVKQEGELAGRESPDIIIVSSPSNSNNKLENEPAGVLNGCPEEPALHSTTANRRASRRLSASSSRETRPASVNALNDCTSPIAVTARSETPQDYGIYQGYSPRVLQSHNHGQGSSTETSPSSTKEEALSKLSPSTSDATFHYDGSKYWCHLCYYGSPRLDKIEQHIKAHNGKWKCDLCGKAFIKNCDLFRHQAAHAAGRVRIPSVPNKPKTSTAMVLRLENIESGIQAPMQTSEYDSWPSLTPAPTAITAMGAPTGGREFHPEEPHQDHPDENEDTHSQCQEPVQVITENPVTVKQEQVSPREPATPNSSQKLAEAGTADDDEQTAETEGITPNYESKDGPVILSVTGSAASDQVKHAEDATPQSSTISPKPCLSVDTAVDRAADNDILYSKDLEAVSSSHATEHSYSPATAMMAAPSSLSAEQSYSTATAMMAAPSTLNTEGHPLVMLNNGMAPSTADSTLLYPAMPSQAPHTAASVPSMPILSPGQTDHMQMMSPINSAKPTDLVSPPELSPDQSIFDFVQMYPSSTGQVRMRCKFCSYGTMARIQMEKHVKAHFDSRKLCRYCGKAFERNYDLMKHEQRHMNGMRARSALSGKVKTKGIKMRPFRYTQKPVVDLGMVRRAEPKLAKPVEISSGIGCVRLDSYSQGILVGTQVMHCSFKSNSMDLSAISDMPTGALVPKVSSIKDVLAAASQVPADGPFITVENGSGEKTELAVKLKDIMNTGKTKDERYVCDRCNSTFCDLHDYLQHQEIHTDEKPKVNKGFSCDHCELIYGSRAGLDDHIALSHKPKKQNTAPPACDECDASFASKSELEDHILAVHTFGDSMDLTLHTCKYCEKDFPSKENLVRHELMHRRRNKKWTRSYNTGTNKNPRKKCPVCLKYVSKYYLTRHMMTRHHIS